MVDEALMIAKNWSARPTKDDSTTCGRFRIARLRSR
jgi:hypothetical protein